ncbi:MAG: hypothetical protein MUE81_02375 [Thermoflexibacter sp.]|nr:hypothetical protein [Thermoflexibacter sp.]
MKKQLIILFLLISSFGSAQKSTSHYKKVYNYDEYKKDWALVKTITNTYGFIDRKGNEVVQAIYSKIFEFEIQKDGKKYAMFKNIAGQKISANEQKIGENLTLQYGFRYSTFQYMGAGEAYEFGQEKPNTRRPVTGVKNYRQWETIQNYGNFEPRFSLNYEINSSTSIKASYNRMAQYIHLVSNTAAATPVDVWTPSTNNIKPQLADQFALGLFKNFQDNTYETSLEVYYKDMQNQLDFIDNSDLLLNRYLEGDLLQGIGRAYGAEFYIKKNKGKFTGWISYTLSRTERQVNGLNNDDWFPNRFDRPHNLNTSVSYEFNQYWSASANFVLQSGTPVTFPTSRVQIQDYVIPYNVDATRNNFRVPTYHRLDFSVTKINKKKKPNQRWESNWVFSIYNAYNRRNPFTIYFRRNADVPINTEAVRLAIIGSIVPAVSYNFKF